MFRFYAYNRKIEGSVNKHFTQFNQEMSVYLPTNHQLLPVTCYSYTIFLRSEFNLYVVDCMRTIFKSI